MSHRSTKGSGEEPARLPRPHQALAASHGAGWGRGQMAWAVSQALSCKG